MAGSVEFLQESFAGGEISPRLRGRVRTERYGVSLKYCENLRPTPQGSLLMRCGTEKIEYAGAVAPRLFPFRAANGEEYVIEASTAQVRLYSRTTGALVPTTLNSVSNGGFDTPVGWGTEGVAWFNVDGTARLPNTAGSNYVVQHIMALGVGNFTIRFRYRGQGTLRLKLSDPADGATVYHNEVFAPSAVWQNKVVAFAASAVGTSVLIATEASDGGDRFIDDVWIDNGVQTNSVGSPWTTDAQLEEVHYDSEPAKSRTVLTHHVAGVRVFGLSPWGGWTLEEARFVSPPAAWRAGNWPRRVEVGFQGRMILGSTPEEPNAIWGSKSGAPFDFTTGSNPGDAYSWTVSLKGGINWIRGQRVLLLGSESLEHSASGSSGLITGADIDVGDESAFGSAPVQALHLGDQVAFVTRDRKALRALSYSQESNGWIAQALSFIAEHLVTSVKEVHLARSPDQLLLLVMHDGALVAVTYDRSQEVLAWWRVGVGASVKSMAVADGPSGSEAWLSVARAAGAYVERLRLYEAGGVYVDAAVSGVVAEFPGTNPPVYGLAGLAHLEGAAVRVLVAGALLEDQVVAGGKVVVDAEHASKSIVVGLPFRAKAVTLPPEGGNPRGTSQRSRRRWVQGFLRLNESALPLVNGKRAPDRSPSSPMDAAEPLFTGDSGPFSTDWGDGTVTIEQDLPFRTEVLAMFGSFAQSEV